MTATIWTQPGCGACLHEKALLVAEGYEVEEKTVTDPVTMDRDAFAQLHLQDGMFPVVLIEGAFRIPYAIQRALEWTA